MPSHYRGTPREVRALGAFIKLSRAQDSVNGALNHQRANMKLADTLKADLGAEIEQAIRSLDFDELRQTYWRQGEFLFIKEFLPREIVEQYLVPQAQTVKPLVNRNYVPGHKKGGSVSYFQVIDRAPRFLELYRSPAFLEFLNRLVGAKLMLCPDSDPHSCALYYYTEAGDHIGYHYDTSYYKGARYTILMGLVDRSEHCRLVCQLHKKDPAKTSDEMRLATGPGDLARTDRGTARRRRGRGRRFRRAPSAPRRGRARPRRPAA